MKLFFRFFFNMEKCTNVVSWEKLGFWKRGWSDSYAQVHFDLVTIRNNVIDYFHDGIIFLFGEGLSDGIASQEIECIPLSEEWVERE